MSNVIVDDSQVTNLFDKLSDENRSTILFKALKKGAKALQETTQTNLRSAMGSSANSMVQGVKLKADKAYSEISVHIMGDYRLKWFEKGTKIRKTKGHKITGYDKRQRVRSGKGGNRGAIKALYYFRKARQNPDYIDLIVTQSITEQLK